MNKNSFIGLVLIGAVLFGFSWYQSKQFEKQQADVKAYSDSLQIAQAAQDGFIGTSDTLAGERTAPAEVPQKKSVAYKDSSLCAAALDTESFVQLHNSKLDIVFTTRGAQPYSVNIKEYKFYGGDSLYLVKPGQSDFGISIYAGEAINTRNFNFAVVENDDSTVVMRLPFANGGYIQQKFTLPKDSYMVYNELSFCDMGGVVPRNVSLFDIDWSVDIPRMEKGYKNEKQYSKMAVYCPGDKKPDIVGKGGRDADKRYDNRVEWFGFDQQFFSAIMTAPDGFASGEFALKFVPETDPSHNLMACKASLRHDISLKEGNAAYNFEFYFGPNSYQILKSFDRKYDKLITVGGEVIGLITRYVIIPCFNWMSSGIANFGIIILLMTLLIKLVVSPLTLKSYISSAKMNAIKPEIDKLNEKFPKAQQDQREAMKKQQATMDLYKRAGINPAGGCIPALLQFPILWAMFRFFPASIELRQQPFLWAEDLSAYDSICDFGFRILGMDHLSLFALLMAVSMFFYSKITMPQSNDPQMAPMRFMTVWIMPIMMFFICNGLSSGLSYYYLLSNIVMFIQTFIIRKFVIKPEKIIAQIEANKGKPIKKSKWQLRLEAAQKMAEQQQKKR